MLTPDEGHEKEQTFGLAIGEAVSQSVEVALEAAVTIGVKAVVTMEDEAA